MSRAGRCRYDAELRRTFACRNLPLLKDHELDLTVELITHPVTPARNVPLVWYPAPRLEMDEAQRSNKRTKFGGSKFVYRAPVMRELRAFFEDRSAAGLGNARILYRT